MTEDPTGGLRRRVRLLLPVESAGARAAGADASCRVGILGGSFNPAHDGHRYLSVEALRRLDLDRIWWLVAPQNPLEAHGRHAAAGGAPGTGPQSPAIRASR